MAAVTAPAPCRVDLAGRTVGIWPICLLHPGATTVNVAIDLWQGVTLRSAASDRVVDSRGGATVFRDRRELVSHPEFALLGAILEFARCPAAEIEVSSAV